MYIIACIYLPMPNMGLMARPSIWVFLMIQTDYPSASEFGSNPWFTKLVIPVMKMVGIS